MNTTKKIALACTIGGIVCTIVALIVNPLFWWLGTIAGFITGYLSYDFREVYQVFIGIVKNELPSTHPAIQKLKSVKRFLSEQHPYIYAGIICAAVSTYVFIPLMVMYESSSSVLKLLYFSLSTFGTVYFVTIVVIAFLQKCAYIYTPEKEQNFSNETYVEVYFEVIKGAAVLISFLGFVLWIKLFLAIHSEKRLLCAIDGVLGGVISYFYFHSTNSITETIMAALLGGLVGAFLGVLSWEIISKRIIKVKTKT